MLQRRLPMLLYGPYSFTNCPFLLGDLHPHLICGSLGPPESSSRTASRSVNSRSCTADCRASHYLTMSCYISPKITPSRWVIGSPIQHTTAHTSHHRKRHVDRFSHFVRVSNAMLYNALSMGKKTPKIIASSPWYFARGSGDMLRDRQTDRQTHTHTCSWQLHHRSFGPNSDCMLNNPSVYVLYQTTCDNWYILRGPDDQ